MKILSFNCHNSIKEDESKNHSKILANYIINNNYDIIGTQEMSDLYTKYLDEYLDDYAFSGGYRFNLGLFNRLPLVAKMNENNSIQRYKD